MPGHGRTSRTSLQADLTDAMRARDELRTATLRMALTAITNEEVAGKQARELSDDEVAQGHRPRGQEAPRGGGGVHRGGRPERAERERAEGACSTTYLPAQLDRRRAHRARREAVAESARRPAGRGRWARS